ncbi:TPA: hypothetical protein L6A27_00600 [Pseudomonas aeruginosa]|nr:hypothetical protein IPC434_00865 [Pseudomonas aeruginosa]RQF90095.1 hypothetical protein IPC241_10285 [Pseudomonas aeruginosa]HBP6036053.1 hypothetical protein [Pseudomonas aeruginosa]
MPITPAMASAAAGGTALPIRSRQSLPARTKARRTQVFHCRAGTRCIGPAASISPGSGMRPRMSPTARSDFFSGLYRKGALSRRTARPVGSACGSAPGRRVRRSREWFPPRRSRSHRAGC